MKTQIKPARKKSEKTNPSVEAFLRQLAEKNGSMVSKDGKLTAEAAATYRVRSRQDTGH